MNRSPLMQGQPVHTCMYETCTRPATVVCSTCKLFHFCSDIHKLAHWNNAASVHPVSCGAQQCGIDGVHHSSRMAVPCSEVEVVFADRSAYNVACAFCEKDVASEEPAEALLRYELPRAYGAAHIMNRIDWRLISTTAHAQCALYDVWCRQADLRPICELSVALMSVAFFAAHVPPPLLAAMEQLHPSRRKALIDTVPDGLHHEALPLPAHVYEVTRRLSKDYQRLDYLIEAVVAIIELYDPTNEPKMLCRMSVQMLRHMQQDPVFERANVLFEGTQRTLTYDHKSQQRFDEDRMITPPPYDHYERAGVVVTLRFFPSVCEPVNVARMVFPPGQFNITAASFGMGADRRTPLVGESRHFSVAMVVNTPEDRWLYLSNLYVQMSADMFATLAHQATTNPSCLILD